MQRKALQTALNYLLFSIFCAIFGAIYELFSHEVYSFYMIYAFGFPLVWGVLPFLLIGRFCASPYPCSLSRNFYHAGIATITVGSIVRGVLDIYGTSNVRIKTYWGVGIVLIVASVVVFIRQYRAESK